MDVPDADNPRDASIRMLELQTERFAPFMLPLGTMVRQLQLYKFAKLFPKKKRGGGSFRASNQVVHTLHLLKEMMHITNLPISQFSAPALTTNEHPGTMYIDLSVLSSL